VSQFRLNRESADASLAAARTGEEALRQQVVLQTVQLASQRESLRRAAQLQQEQQELLRLQLEQARVRQNQGQGSAQQISALEIQLNRARDAELRNTLAARELALGLERLTGRTVPEQSIIVFPDATGGADHDDGREGGDSGLADGVRSPQVARAESELRAAEADYQLARKQAGATANLAITATPRYRDEREDPEDPATVFSDFTGDGSGVDLNLVLTLEIPLTEGGARRRAVEQAQLSLELAESALERTRREQDSQSVLAELRIETLAQRIELLEFELAFEREQLQSDRELQELGSATRVDIARRLLTITGRENELANLRTELLLQQLELIRLRGDDPATFVLREKTE
jgi:outer membrane protein TolC